MTRRPHTAALALLALLAAPTGAAAKDKGPFLDRLAAGEIAIAKEPVPETTLEAERKADLAAERIPDAEDAVNEIIDQLIAANTDVLLRRPVFMVSSKVGDTCWTTMSAGAIVCTQDALDSMRTQPGGRDMLAFIIAHELSHTAIVSHRARFAKSSKLKGGWGMATLGVAVLANNLLNKRVTSGNTTTIVPTNAGANALFSALFVGGGSGMVADGVASPKWSRDDEDEADALAIKLLCAAHRAYPGAYDPNAAVQTFAWIASVRKARSGVGAKALDAALQAGVVHAAYQGSVLTGALSAGVSALGVLVAGNAERHFHAAADERGRLVVPVIQRFAGPADTAETERASLFAPPAASVAATPAAVAAAPGAARAGPGRKGRSRRGAGTVGATVTVVAAPRTKWQRFAESASFGQLRTAGQVQALVAANDPKNAAALCPPDVRSTHLALWCGIARAGISDPARARPLLDQALRQASADPSVGADVFREASRAQVAMHDEPAALATLAAGQQRLASADLIIDEIRLRSQSGDLAGAKAAADRCGAMGKEPAATCQRALRESAARRS